MLNLFTILVFLFVLLGVLDFVPLRTAHAAKKWFAKDSLSF